MTAEVRLALRWAAVAALLAGLCWRVADTPLVILVAAVAPAGVYVLLIALLDRRNPEPPSLLLAAFLAGAVVAAAIAALLNAMVQGWIAAASSSSDARELAPLLAVPVVEELAKGVALLAVAVVALRDVGGVRDGIVYGALVGIGFAVSENLLYLSLAALQGGYPGLLRGAYLRAVVYGVNHAAFTATTGAALGYARTASTRTLAVLVGLLGFAAAITQHALWNTVASEAIEQLLCGAGASGAACRAAPSAWSLYVAVPLLAAVFIGPGVMTLLALAALSREDDGPRTFGSTSRS